MTEEFVERVILDKKIKRGTRDPAYATLPVQPRVSPRRAGAVVEPKQKNRKKDDRTDALMARWQ